MIKGSVAPSKAFGAVIGVILLVAVATVAAAWVVTVVEEGGIRDTWDVFEPVPAKRAAVLSELRTSLGYGGLIHAFKDYVLRQDPTRKEQVEAKIAGARQAIAAYLAQEINPRERAALRRLSEVIDNYAAHLVVADAKVQAGQPPSMIDLTVKIDDTPALEAIALLSAEYNLLRQTRAAALRNSVDTAVLHTQFGVLVLGGSLVMLLIGLGWFVRANRTSRQAQIELRENEQRLSGIMNNVSEAIVTADELGMIQSFNKAAENMFGYSVDNIVGQSIHMLIPEEAREAHQLGESAREVIGQHCDGDPLDLELAINEMYLGDKKVLINVIRDISERRKSRRDLEQSQQRLNAILDNTPAIIWMQDENSCYELVNDEFVERFGLPRDEVIGKTDREVFSGEYSQAFESVRRRVRTTGRSQIVEELVEERDGLHTRLSVQFPLEMRDGQTRSICGISTDITQRKVDERALSESKLRLAHAHRIAKLSHWIWDEVSNRLTYCSDDLAGLFGVSREDVPSTVEAWVAFIHPADREATRSLILDSAQRQTGYETEYRIVRHDGSVCWVLVLTEAEFDEAGCFVRTLGTAQDITERKAAEEALRTKTATVELLQVVAVAANAATSVDDALQTCLDEVCAHISWPVGHVYMVRESDPPELESSRIWHIDETESHKAFRKVTEEMKFSLGLGLPGRVWASGEPEWISDIHSDANFLRGKDDAHLNVGSGFAFPLLVGRDVAAVLEFFSPDITEPDFQVLEVMAHVGAQLGRVVERKTAEKALRGAKEVAEQASKSKSVFLANMSHELRTPLNAIIGFSDIISTELFGRIDNAKYIEYASDINESGEHLLELINDILDLSKIEAGKLELQEAETSIDRIVDSCLIFVQERAKASNLSLARDVPDNLPTLFGDERKIKQILLNLLSNAVKFTPPGGDVTVRVTVDDESVYFAVIDSGIGIAPEDIPKALAVFGQVDSRHNRKYEGTGLGLPLSEALARLHGGSLSLNSDPAKGTTVIFALPVERLVAKGDSDQSASA
jgi:PAS domain S-box-containing protein